VLFDPAKEKPEFAWFASREISSEDEEDYQMLETNSILGGDTSVNYQTIQYNARLDRHLDNTITITYRDTFLIDGSPPNKSVASITTTQPGQCHDWRGPIIAYARKGPDMNAPAVKDLDMVDYRHVADYFLSYARHIKGVRINCLGDELMLKRPHFEAIEVPATHEIFASHDTSDVVARIGLPILTKKCPPDPKWINSHDPVLNGRDAFENQDATFLHQCCDPRAKFDPSIGSLGWGSCSLPWQNEVGSVLVVREDGKPLLPLHMEALVGYCRKEVQPLLGHSIGECYPEDPISKHHALAIICRPMFVVYWNRFLEEKKVYDSPGPYDEDL